MHKGSILGFIFGLVVGGAASGLGVYGVMKKKHDKEMTEALANKHAFEPVSEEEDDVPDMYKRTVKKEEETPVLSPEEKQKIKDKLRYNNEKTTAYSKMYSTGTYSAGDIIDMQAEADTENGEPIPGEEESEDPERDGKAVTSNIFDEIKKHRAPRIVKESEVDAEPEGWDVVSLYLYNDGTVTDEEDKVYDDTEKQHMLGDCLTKYDFINSDEKIIYVQCFEKNTFYEINKFDKPFEK